MKTSKAGLWKEIKKNRDMYIMLAPFAILFFIFTVLAVIAAIVLGFTDFNMVETPKFVGWSNFVRIFLDDDVFLIAVRNTLIFAIITGPLSYFLCLLFAWMINELPHYLRILMTFVFYVPSISGSVYVIWSYIFSGDSYGLANSTLLRLGLINEPILWLSDTRYMLTIIIIVQLWSSLGTSFLSFIAGLQGVDRALYEAGAIDGIRTRFQELWLITLPSMGPQLMFAAVMQIGAAFSVGGICTALAGFPSTDYAAHTIITHISDHGTTRFEMGYACALATILFIAMVGTNSLIRKVLTKKTNL
ncbi:MAG: sugar ABC transporter permease [Oscillospiraceae bacterium]|nr:sugar ABC transporter permease [Oscillospiraceae bacterium]